MKKLESLNSELFKKLEKNQVEGLHKILGGNVPTCTADHCTDTRSGTVDNPGPVISVGTKDC
jgi:hypothetical protein